MISHINGRLIEKTPTYVVIDCNGVGYKLHISLQTYTAIQTENCKLLTHLSIKRILIPCMVFTLLMKRVI